MILYTILLPHLWGNVFQTADVPSQSKIRYDLHLNVCGCYEKSQHRPWDNCKNCEVTETRPHTPAGSAEHAPWDETNGAVQQQTHALVTASARKCAHTSRNSLWRAQINGTYLVRILSQTCVSAPFGLDMLADLATMLAGEGRVGRGGGGILGAEM